MEMLAVSTWMYVTAHIGISVILSMAPSRGWEETLAAPGTQMKGKLNAGQCGMCHPQIGADVRKFNCL